MGKSGIIARNISQMLVSVGIRAMYMSPVDALHGEVNYYYGFHVNFHFEILNYAK